MAGRQKNAAPPPVVADANGHDHTDTDPEITIEDTGGAGETGGADTRQAPPAEDEGVKRLRDQLAEAERRAADAEANLNRERSERGKDQQVIQDSRLAVIDGTITTNETNLNAAKQRLKEALEAGDYDAQVTANAEIAEFTLNLRQAKLGKERLEQQIEEAKTAPKEPVTEDEKFEAWANSNNIHQKSRTWLRGHMDYLTDPVKNADLTKAHHLALRSGHAANTDGYFQAIEEELGLRTTTDDSGTTPEPRQQERQTSVPSAPVSRSGDGGGSRTVSPIPGIQDLGNGKYKVSREIAEAAQMSGVTVAEYVREAMKLQRGSDGQLH